MRKQAKVSRLNFSKGKIRTELGSTLIELAAVAWVLPLAAIIAVNIGLLVFGAYMNDSACRDAVRAAAAQHNKSDARVAAYRALRQFASSSNILSSPQILLTGNYFEFESFPDQEGKPQLEKGPYVRVSTFANAKLPCPVIFAAGGFTDQIVFRQSCTFPIINPDQIAASSPQFNSSDTDELARMQAEAEALSALSAGSAIATSSGF